MDSGSHTAPRYWRFERTRHAIPTLDGLRALAILMVLARHAIDPLFRSDAALLPLFGWDAAIPLVNGWVGVDLFFALSGFLIGGHLIRTSRQPGGLKVGKYLTARALRIVPTYYVVLLFAAAGLFPYYSLSHDGMGLRLAYHLLFLQDYLPANIVVSFWSLGVEEKFYLLAPLVIYSTARTDSLRKRYLLLSVLLFVPLMLRCVTAMKHPDVGQYNVFFFVFRSPFHLSFDGMIAGVIAAHLYDDIKSQRLSVSDQVLRWGYHFALLSVGLHLCVSPLLESITYYDKTFQGLALSASFAMVVLYLALSKRPHSVLTSQVGLVFARLSYPLYLVHLPIVSGFLMYYRALEQNTAWGLFLYCFGFASASIGAAALVHFVIEKPSLLMKDKMARGETTTTD